MMFGMAFGLLWMVVTILISPGNPVPADQYTRGVDWLSRYGYLAPPDPRTSKLQTKEGIEKAIRIMQRFGGLRETGKLDEETMKLMSMPRCSLPDIVGHEDMKKRRRKRRKRYALSGLLWDKTDLTWSILNYPSSTRSPSLTSAAVVTILTRAFQTWSDVAPLSFHQVPRGDKEVAPGAGGDIRVSFASSLHDDGYPFDGRGGTLAHAFFPGRDDIAGDTHFDDDEVWSNRGESDSTDLFTVAVHEFGHALGLSHSSDPSIMRPYYQGAVGDINSYRLPLDDTLAIQELYGRREKLTTPEPDGGGSTRRPRPPTPPPPRPTLHSDSSAGERCSGGFDAVANIRGEVFFFKGPKFWRIQQTGSLLSLNPALIKNFWIGLPPGTDKIDAVYERKSDSRIIFFIGDQYWVFQDTRALPDYPRPLSEWGMRSRVGGQPVRRVDAAFVWAHNGKTYLFSNGEFWRFDESRMRTDERREPEAGYPRDATLWKDMPSHPDDIITWGEGDAYFFKNNLYWVVKRGQMDQDDVTSKSVAVEWLMCPAPAPTQRPRGCNCDMKGSSAKLSVSWLIVPSVLIGFVLN